jgi:hypothetical protein
MKQLNWYQIFGKSNIPDGRTVLPTDDVQIWLHCADIWNKAYTTLAEVLADTTTLAALIASNNAVDYMVRSTTWAIAQALVPTMTSDTTPSGECLARDYENAGTGIYKAFDNNLVDSHWYSKWQVNPAGNYIGYHFTESVVVNRAIYDTTDLTSTAYCPHNVKVQGSNDNSAWTDLASDSWTQAYGRHVVELSNTTAYEYYRFYIVDGYSSKQVGATEVQFYSASIPNNATAMSYIGLNNYCANTLLADSTWCEAICNSEYFESVLNVKVPAMTSNTTPSGVGVCVSTNDSPSAYKAFDGDDSTNYSLYIADFTYCGFHFDSPLKVYKAFSIGRDNRDQKHKIIASNDGITWTDLSDFVTYTSAMNRRNTFLLNPSIQYSYYADQIARDGNYGLDERTLQFWGRVDV